MPLEASAGAGESGERLGSRRKQADMRPVKATGSASPHWPESGFCLDLRKLRPRW